MASIKGHCKTDWILDTLQPDPTAIRADIHKHLSRLGLTQYMQKFIDEGFDRWETILLITEPDL